MVRLGEPVLDPARHRPRTDGGLRRAFADYVEAHGPGEDRFPVSRLLGKLDAPSRQICLANRLPGNRCP